MYLTHPLILLTTLLPTLPLTTASPAPLSLPRPIPSPDTTTTTTPWHLNNITLFRAAPGVGASYIHFQFQDTRPGFRLKTDCRRFVLPGEVPGIDDAETTYGCANGTVGFGFDRGRFEVTRSYIDERYVSPFPPSPFPFLLSVTSVVRR